MAPASPRCSVVYISSIWRTRPLSRQSRRVRQRASRYVAAPRSYVSGCASRPHYRCRRPLRRGWSEGNAERLLAYDGVSAKDLTYREALTVLKLRRFERALAEHAMVCRGCWRRNCRRGGMA
jgi:hypothetical protein